MPEGVEVKIITDQLSAKFCNSFLQKAEIIGGRFMEKIPVGWELLVSELEKNPLPILNIKCKGKFIYWMIGKFVIWNTLGMSGTWGEKEKHSAIKFEIIKKSNIINACSSIWQTDFIYFTDPRHFGTLKIILDLDFLQTKKKLNSLGEDMLNGPPTEKEFISMTKKYSTQTLPEVLMNQKIISGIGNYIKAESLYLAGISPWRLIFQISDQELGKLYHAIITVIQKSYQSGGTSLVDYKDINGTKGNYQDNLACYKKKKDSEGNEIIAEETRDKRTTYWCPAKQT